MALFNLKRSPGHGKPCPPESPGGPGNKKPPKNPRRSFKSYAPFIMATLATLLTLSLVIFPKEAFKAGLDGMHIFWDIVFPSLLPFFVLSDILMGLGVVHFLGVLLEPLMRPLFNVPGVGAFALSMGLAAGYPMDAVITARFRSKNLCTKVEAERLLAFTNTADPLFILGAVAVGMFASPRLGAILAIAHYLSSLAIGLAFRFYKRNDPPSRELQGDHLPIFHRAAKALLKANREDGRTFGKLLGESVRESITTLLMICGFIMLFSVVVRVSTLVGITALITPVLGSLLNLVGLHPSLADATFRGIMEIDLGTIASAKAAAPLLDRVVVASFIIAWSGLSVHAQVASVIVDCDVRMSVYAVSRLFQGLFAGFFAFLLMGPLGGFLGWTESVFSPAAPIALAGFQVSGIVVQKWILGFAGSAGLTCLMLLGSLGISGGKGLKGFLRKALR